MNQEICTCHQCLKIMLMNKYEGIQNKYTATLVEEMYDLNGNFKGQTRYGNYKLNYCPECGKEIDIETIIKEEKHDT